MAKVLVVFNSMTGNTEAAAKGVAKGAQDADAQVVLKEARKTTLEDLTSCDGIAFGSYDAFSYMGGDLKDLFDRSLYPSQGKLDGKPYVAFITHGGGGGAIKSIESIAEAMHLKKAAQSVLVKGYPDAEATSQLIGLGGKLAMACLRR